MRKLLFFSILLLLFTTSCQEHQASECNQIYIISTNDIHANINVMPQLVSLVKEYSTRGEVLLVDSGDRVVGNAFVDDGEQPGVPMMVLLNAAGYDVITLGNHEFDNGREGLNNMLKVVEGEVVCANVKCNKPMDKEIKPYTLITLHDVTLGFTGVVDTDGGGLPLGNSTSYEDFSITRDVDTAYSICATLSEKADFVVLLSHMGYTYDEILAQQGPKCDWIAGGHSHDKVGKEVNGVHISQNGKNLGCVTIAQLDIADGEIQKVTYLQEAIDDEIADEQMVELVAHIKSLNPELNSIEGYATAFVNKDGVANFTIDALANYPYADGFKPEVSFYHYGGIRLSNILPGDITRGDIYNNDPFRSTIILGEMSGKQIHDFILAKYNNGTPDAPDKESHYAYLRSDLAYTIVVGDTPKEAPDALDIISALGHDKMYRVAMCNYIANNYIDKSIVEAQLHESGVSVREAMMHHIHSLNDGLTPDNTVHQKEIHYTELNK